MSTLKSILFESPLWLGVCSFLLFAVVLLARPRWTGRKRRYSLPATFAAIVLLFIIQSLVTTQRELIATALDGLISAMQQKDAAALRRIISPQYDHGGLDHDAAIAETEAFWQAFTIRDARVTRQDVTFDGNQAEMILGARATVSIRGGIGEQHFGQWKITWRHEPDGWKTTALEPQMIDGRPTSHLRGWREITD